METTVASTRHAPIPAPRDVLQLLKPITWFPPMWAFMCGAVSSGAGLEGRWWFVAGGVLLAGPLVCGTSQAVNDWFDRHVDAINEPDRPIPSGRIAGRWGLYIALIGTLISAAVALALGELVFVAALVGLALAWGYSMPPFRFKTSGWTGPLVVGLTYEGLSWFTGATVMLGALPSSEVLVVLVLYSLGAHGIMTLNDFKAVEGDRATGLKSLPVVMGVEGAAIVACAVMAAAQVVVVALLMGWGYSVSASVVGIALVAQFLAMPRLVSDPAKYAPWYNGVGVTLYVLGMLAAALGLGGYI
ncbi:chlorophyll synthase [Erythrobacter litoralis]|jgi:chlorophyll synthase|uniref:Bacteriochlorophyll/chlorophyll synthetase n=1 Tax=Erythrobacter litoralis TaxID=39960 RepID=A0A074MJ68_9SPHN|nr:chlorophyll synthase ChlG [Erythrobacter litoralis]AOL22849.1 chlorophyll synthase [Erythrobacter litoralis]KEO92850.1 bacteriochlorophyll/chlorophyll synthetase [Erythrobacter litoralis]MEE4338644.1 chlorophyll synthase ChlG [Erythrobacter sp.]